MLSPSIQNHYNAFISTMTESDSDTSLTSLSVCFLFPFAERYRSHLFHFKAYLMFLPT